jgi:hypothetical protein
MKFEDILALLATKFTGARKDGLSQLSRIISLQQATEEEAKALVEKLTKAQVDDFIKEFRAEVDREVSESNKTAETNLRKKFDFVEKKEPEPSKSDAPDPTKKDDPTDIAAMIKNAVAEAVKPFQTELAGYKAGNVEKVRLQSLTEKLNNCKDTTFKEKVLKDFARIKFETDDEFNEYLTDTEKDITTANQNVANSTLGNAGKPFSANGNNGTGVSKEEVEAIAKSIV